MELRALLLLPLCFPGLQAQTPAEERQPEGSTLYVQCPYTAQVTYQELKAWCRWRDGRWEILVETAYPTPYTITNTKRDTQGRVTVEDNSTKRTVTITITDLQVEDSGTYSCAYYSSYRYVLLKKISLIVFKELYKWELDSLSVQCPYSTTVDGNPVYSMDIKAWCQLYQTWCNILGRSDDPSTQNHKKAQRGRVLIQDDTKKRTVTITMQKLQAQDTGVYRCVLYTPTRLLPIMEVKLSVAKRMHQYAAKESGNVSVQCTYSAPDYWAVTKAWCKESAANRCNVLVSTDMMPSGDLRTPQQGRVTIQDDTDSGVVTITMEELQVQDSGVYWCALYEHTGLSRMVEVTLSISKVSAETTLSGSAGTTQTTPAGNSPEPSSNANTFVLLAGVLSILFLLALIGSITLWVRLKRRGTRQAKDIYDKPEDIAQLDSTDRMESPQDDSKDLKYATLTFKSRLSPEDPLYCNVEPSQAHGKPEDEHVEYATIALKELPTNDKG